MAIPRLSVTDTNGQRVVPIEASPFSVGRRATARSAGRRRRHLARPRGDRDRWRGYLLRDVGSRFGTFLNGVALSGPSPLAHGDRIRLGVRHDVELTFLVDDEQTSSFITGGAPASSFQQMAAILNGLRALGSGRVLDEVLTLVLDSAIDVTRAERGFIMLADAGRQLQFRVAREKGKRSLAGTSFTTSAKVPREVFETGRSLIVSDLLDDALAGGHDGTVALGIRHVLCVPLTVSSHAGSGLSPDDVGHRGAVSRWPRTGHAAVAGDAVVARGVRDTGGAGHRQRAAVCGSGRKGAARSRPADGGRHPARAPAAGGGARPVLLAGRHVDSVPDDRRRFLRLPRSRRPGAELRARRRVGQGPAGGAPRRHGAEQLRGARPDRRRPWCHGHRHQPGSAASSHRRSLHDAVPRRAVARRAVGLLQRRP